MKLIRHLDQLSSSCATLIDDPDLVSISLPLQPQVLPLDTDQGGPDMDFAYDDYHPTSNDVEMTQDDQGASSKASSSNVPESRYREDFTGASVAYGTGETFMEKFDSDGFTEQRKDNPYYPFASKADWEMGSFLIWLRLSMANIDIFLKLESVSTSQFECPEII